MRPLSIGELLDVAIKVTTRNIRTFVMIVLVVVAPLRILQTIITASAAPELLKLNSTTTPVATDTFVAGIVAQGLVGVVVFLVSTAACTNAVADAYQGSSPDWRASLRFAVRKSPSLAWLSLVLLVALVVALVLLIVPAIWLAVAWSVAVPVLLIEGRGGPGALRRSFALVRGRWWPVAGALLVGFLLAGVLGGIVQGLLGFLPALLFDDNLAVTAVATAVGAIVSSLITTPFQAAIVTLLYFDLRVRKEGLDLEGLISRAGERGDGGDTDLGTGTRPLPPTGLVTRQYTAEERAQAPYWPPPAGWKPTPPPESSTGWLAPQAADPADDG